MKKYFVLKDFDSEVLNISFKEISECISFDYCWSILWIEGSGRNALISMETLEQSINQSEAGIIISFEKLQSLIESIDDLHAILIVGDSNRSKTRRYGKEENIYQSCSITIELIDSSYWEISSDNVEFNNRLNSLFGEVKEVENFDAPN